MQDINFCECVEKAVWVYMPSYEGYYPYFCDEHVPRNCLSCDHYSLEEFPEMLQEAIDLKWKFRIGENVLVHLDEQGRNHPCVEYFNINSTMELIWESKDDN